MLERTCLAPHAVARWASETPDAVALERVDGEALTYAELHDQGRAWAAVIEALGVRAGDHVATLLPNTFDSHRALLALGWLRVVEVPLNTAYVGRMLAYTVDHSDATTLVTTSEYVDRVIEIRDDVPKLERSRGRRRRRVPRRNPGRLARRGSWPGPEYRDIHSLMFTSGTTGPSKAVITPWAVMYQFWSWVPDDALVAGRGRVLHHADVPQLGAIGVQLRPRVRCALRDAGSLQRDRLLGRRARHRLPHRRAHRADDRACSTRRRRRPPTRDNPLRDVILGPMIPEIDDFERRFGVRTATCYGQTEVGIPIATGWDHGPWANCGRKRMDYPWPDAVVVNEHDEPVGVGRSGRVGRAERGAVGAQRRLLQDAGTDGGGVAERLVPHRRRVPGRRRRLVLLRRPPPRRHPSAGREHLLVRGRDLRDRTRRRGRVRGDRRSGDAR